MSDRLSATHVSWLFAVASGFAPAARAIEPSVVSTSSTRDPLADSESSFERAFRLRSPSAEEIELAPGRSLVTPGVLDAAERRALADEFRPKLATATESGENPGIPNHPALSDAFFFGAGVFYANSTTEAQLNSSIGVGTNVDFEDALGLAENDLVPQGLARWRFSDRWRLELEYFALNRSNTKAIDGDIIWGDDTFPDGTQVEAKFDIAVTRLSCGYSFFKTQDKEIGVALGFHITDINAKLSSTGTDSDEGKLLAPLPVISLYGQCALTDIWAVSGRFDAFRLEYDPYQGHVYSFGIDALCQPWRHFGFGLGFRSLQIGGSVDSGDWDGEVRSTYSGPIAFASVSF